MTPTPPAPTPRRVSRRAWAFLRHPGPRGGDGLLALAATVLGLYVLYELAPGTDRPPMLMNDVHGTPFLVASPDEQPGAWASLLCALTTAALAWRRSRPAAAFGVQVCAVLPSSGDDPTVVGIVALALGAYSVAAHVGRLPVAATVFAWATLALVARFPDDTSGGPPGTIVLAVMATTWVTGRTIGTWRTRAGAFHGRALRAEHEREVAVARERARIAREFHDVVSHNVSVMVIQSGAARMVLRSDPDSAVEALRAVETSGRETMAELRHLLGVLTTADEPAPGGRPAAPDGDAPGPPLAPQPDLTRLPVLVDRVRTAGLDVRLETCGDARPLPPGVELTAYRVVQEALTNALKYAPGTHAEVTLAYRRDTVRVGVADDGPADGRRPERLGAGRGLLGLTERVALHGGRLEAGPRPTGGYRVRATIPVPAA
ncbi:histidine kinase [Yinghuangia sp. ASG 101]|uniref:sensor histidine kinase n=1 Tax=Yinghuangia sp. ASG 101 TaxID=2896848 RepID=UPI001E3FF40D|nr:histidine kinase [Yinghuangia sp. ASG 101]UGQ08951.1 histidine kinase [Yinghuangia sp. ASG 101]